MTTDRPTPPTEERAREDAELGFPPQLADRLRTSMTTAVADVHAPVGLHDEVQARHRRRRRMTRSGLALAGAAAVVGVALAINALPTSPIVVDVEPADRPTEDGVVTVLTDDGVAVQIPAFELASDDDGLHLLERGSDGKYVERRTVLTPADLQDLVGGDVSRLSVRPGSTVDELQAVVFRHTFDRSTDKLITIELTDGGETVSAFTWEGEAQLPEAAVELATAWSPDGRSFAYLDYDNRGRRDIFVLDIDDEGRPTVVGRAPADPSSFLAWVDAPDDGFSLWTAPFNRERIVATRWVRLPDGSVERLDVEAADEAAYDSPAGGTGTQLTWAVWTPHGVVEGLGGDGETIRLLKDGEVARTVEVPARLGESTRARLTTIAGEPVVLADHENGQVAIAPMPDTTLDVAVLPTPSSATPTVDWVD